MHCDRQGTTDRQINSSLLRSCPYTKTIPFTGTPYCRMRMSVVRKGNAGACRACCCCCGLACPDGWKQMCVRFDTPPEPYARSVQFAYRNSQPLSIYLSSSWTRTPCSCVRDQSMRIKCPTKDIVVNIIEEMKKKLWNYSLMMMIIFVDGVSPHLCLFVTHEWLGIDHLRPRQEGDMSSFCYITRAQGE